MEECSVCGSEEAEYYDEMENDFCLDCMVTAIDSEYNVCARDFKRID